MKGKIGFISRKELRNRFDCSDATLKMWCELEQDYEGSIVQRAYKTGKRLFSPQVVEWIEKRIEKTENI
jgi:hypothetical protein